MANKHIPSYLLSHPQKPEGKRIENLIVSFTSFPARIEKVWMVVECIKRQTYLPEKIILWLSKDQFPTDSSIPQSLWSRVDELFEIRMVGGDIKSHKKYYYAFRDFKIKTIITIDDDVFYHPDTIKTLVKTSQKYRSCVVANVTARITFTNGRLDSYTLWDTNIKAYNSNNLIQKGIGGVLYPPNQLPALTLREDLFMELAPMADDLWLNAMGRLKNICVVQSPLHLLYLEIKDNSPSLSTTNVGQNKNDEQIRKIRSYFMRNYDNDLYKEN